MLAILGILLAIVSAVAFLVVGALTLFGGTDATNRQVIPGFLPDKPSSVERLLTLLSVWAPVILIALLCLLVGLQIVRVAIGAL